MDGPVDASESDMPGPAFEGELGPAFALEGSDEVPPLGSLFSAGAITESSSGVNDRCPTIAVEGSEEEAKFGSGPAASTELASSIVIGLLG